MWIEVEVPYQRRAEGRMRRSVLKIAICAITLTVSLPSLGYSPTNGVDQNSTFGNIAHRLKNWGLINSQAKSHIQALDAWKLQEGNKNVIVAVIDTGIDPNHKALAQNIWHDKSGNNVYGWNFVTDRPNPVDEHGHGTHVAGIIGAVADPETGVSGVAHKVSIMPVKYYSDSNSGAVNLKNTVRAIKYAVAHGARIINYSGGGPEFSEDEYLAIKEAEARGVIVIAAAGNEHQSTDMVANYYFPSAYRQYKVNNIISVAATDINNNLLASSNWGNKSVDVAAPGENIYSTLPQGKFGYMTGTSQATAFVSGLAALLLSENPNLNPQQIKEIILSSVDPFPQLQGKLSSGGRVNAFKALNTLKNKNAPVNKLNIIAQNPGSSLSQTLLSP